MTTRHLAAHPTHAFGMLLAIPAAAGLVGLGAIAASATTPVATRAATGVAAIAAGTRTSATAITLAHPRTIVVTSRHRSETPH